MRRILIIGSSGAGKSRFSKRLGEQLGIKVIHLDKIYWKPNWIEPSKEDWQKTVEEILRGDEWIIDGNFGGTIEMRIAAADTVLFLDLPRTVCLWRIIKRWVTYRKGSRPDMAEGCDEKIDLKFLKWVWDYPRRSRPNVEGLLVLNESNKTIIRLRSPSEVEEFDPLKY